MENEQPLTIALVGCVASKLPTGAAARDLYISPLFRERRAYAERIANRWYILSALHGLIAPDDYLEPYNLSLKQLNSHQRQAWANRVVSSLDEHEKDLAGAKVEFLAGADYRHPILIDAMMKRGALISVPVTESGIGPQINEYRRLMHGGISRQPTKSDVSEPISLTSNYTPTRAGSGGSYAKLSEFLLTCDSRSIQLTFSGLEKIFGRPLPNSARNHRAWWANEESGTHSHAKSWMGAGWKVDHVDFNQQIVRFFRVK